MQKVLSLLLLALALMVLPDVARAQTNLLGTYTWPTTTAANSTPGGAFLSGQIDVFGGRASAGGGRLQIAAEGTGNPQTRDLLFFNALSTTAAQQKAVISVPGYYATGVALFYNPATNDSYTVVADPQGVPFTVHLSKTTGSPASASALLLSTTLPAGTAFVAGDALVLVAQGNGAGASNTLTYALFDMTHPGAGQPTTPINTSDAGALLTGTYTDSSSAYTSGGYALTTDVFAGGATAFNQVQFYGPPPGLQPSFLTAGAATTTAVPLSWTAALSGTAPVSYSVYRSLTAGFAALSGTLVYGPGTALSFADTPPDHQPYFYAVRAVDSAATPSVSVSNQAAGETLLGPAGLAVGFLGHSEIFGSGDTALGNLGVVGVTPSSTLSAGGSIASAVQILLASTGGLRDVTCYNAGGVGSTAQQWSDAAGGYLYPAVAALPTGCPVVYQIGKNDAKDALATSKATYKGYVLGTVNYMVAHGHPVVLLPEFYVVPGSLSGAWSAPANALIQQYDQALAEIVAADTTGRVQLAAPNLFDFSVIHNDTSWLIDGVHGTDRFSVAEAALLAPPLARLLGIVAPIGPPLTLTVTAGSSSEVLTWTADSGATNGYEVDWKPSSVLPVAGQVKSIVAIVGPGVLTWTDTSAYRLAQSGRYNVVGLH